MSISNFITILAMSLFLAHADVGIIGSISFLIGLAIILASIDNKQQKDDFK
ncbi:hypothetical protein [Lysinibacillus fusiformis]|uniref:hypothetical protein n=1 Tax=Lysinibacillus fusiformis TaxID=28031 RepID=UPI00263BB1C5|nr:hypothetical protein [Lysinibacillus fusiformis]MDC6267256.1 hypothetical protein [Lysinibacillus sphaericus]MDN4968310.1 hypothetical protein [Lysinibacillus fusiformis]MDN4968484.1 hypothetical protein [Lysinibacillus fusiformis]